MTSLIGFLVHFGAIYLGAHFAQIEYIDTWRTLYVSCASYVVLLLLSLLLVPLFFLAPGLFLSPVVSIVLAAAVLATATAIAAKVILSIDWGPAWTIGGLAAGANLLLSWILGALFPSCGG